MANRLTITDGASVTGVWIYRRFGATQPSRRAEDDQQSIGQTWWKTPWQTVQDLLHNGRQRFTRRPLRSATIPEADDSLLAVAERAHDPNAIIRHGWHTSTLALGVTTTGWLIFPSWQIAGLPLLVYLGIQPAQAAYDQLWIDGRPSRALAETVALAVCLAGGYYWVGALGFWLYYGSRQLLAEQSAGKDAEQPARLTPATTHVWQDGAECAVPIASLQPGDQMILHSGELTPVDGLITEGVAWLRPQALSAETVGLRKTVGDRVAATDLVIVGRLCVRVLPTV